MIKIAILTLALSVVSCGSTKPKNQPATPRSEPKTETTPSPKLLEKVTPEPNTVFARGSVVKIGYKADPKVDSVVVTVGNQRIVGQEFVPEKVGRFAYRVVAYSAQESQQIDGQFLVVAEKAPDIQRIKIVRSYPHDPKAYTQGLLYYNGKFYESTGERGRSSLREVEISTGKVLRKRDIDKKYFAEGLALLGGKLFQLTWEEGVVFVWDLASFEKIGELPLSGEGWGITTDGRDLYVSDGSSRITKYDAVGFKKISHFTVADNKQELEYLNELEWIDGKIWANIYTLDLIAVINPETGVVERYINSEELAKKIGNIKNADVLNGIAYDRASGRIWLTGKDWDTLFEISVP